MIMSAERSKRTDTSQQTTMRLKPQEVQDMQNSFQNQSRRLGIVKHSAGFVRTARNLLGLE